MKKLGVIFGGSSVEHEISIISALQAIESLDKSKYEIYPIYISKDNVWYSESSLTDIDQFKDLTKLKQLRPVILTNEGKDTVLKYKDHKLFKNSFITNLDVVLPIVHGTNVEDGKLQGYLETIGAKFTGVDTYGAVVGQDKAYMRDIFKANNIMQVDYIWVTDDEDSESINLKIKEKIGFPVLLKPALLGSSVGIEVVKTEEELEAALESSFSYCYKILVEKYLPEFREMNIALLGNYKEVKTSKIEEVLKTEDILSFADKYQSNSKSKSSGMASLDRVIPANIDNDLKLRIEEVAKKAFKVLCSSGVVRLDLMIVGDEIYVNEINNVPGSLSFYLWDDYPTLLDEIIKIGVNRYFDNDNKQFSFDSNVLSLSAKGTKK